MAYLREKQPGVWSVVWKVRDGYDDNDKPRWRQESRRIGTKREASRFKAQIETRILEGGILGTTRMKQIRFYAFCKVYEEDHTRGDGGMVRDEITIRCHLKPFFEDVLLEDISRQDVNRYKAARAKMVKRSTVNRELDCLKSMFHRAVEWEYLKSSPADGVAKFKLPKTVPPWLPPEKCTKLLDVATGQMRTLIALGVYAGLRKGEMFGLT